MKVIRKITVLLLAAFLILSGCESIDNTEVAQTTSPVTATIPAATEPTTAPEDTTPTTVPIFVSEGYTVLQSSFSGRIYGSKIASECEFWGEQPFEDTNAKPEMTVTIAGVEHTGSYKDSIINVRAPYLRCRYSGEDCLFYIDADGNVVSWFLWGVTTGGTQKYTREECQTLALAYLSEMLDVSSYKLVSTTEYTSSLAAREDYQDYEFTYARYLGEWKVDDTITVTISEFGNVEGVRAPMVGRIPADIACDFDLEKVKKAVCDKLDYIYSEIPETFHFKEYRFIDIALSILEDGTPALFVDIQAVFDWHNGTCLQDYTDISSFLVFQ